MLPESSLRQLKKLRQEVKGKDINDLVSKDETHFPNVYWMDNPVDGGRIQSYEEYTKKDNKKQTTAFKSKLVNKTLVNKKVEEKMSQIKKFENYNEYFSLGNVKTVGDLKNAIKDIPDDIAVLGYNGGNGDLFPISGWMSEDEEGDILVISVD